MEDDMNEKKMMDLAERFLNAWNTQEVGRVLGCYTKDVEYRDPNTRGAVRGEENLRRYLTKLFSGWRMHWTLREAHLFEGGNGCAVLWHATFRRPDGAQTIGVDGMDFVAVEGDRIARNEVWFDRAQIAPLLAARPLDRPAARP
jgi:nuclear transport factor 2 (NTF2) superfamily protein